MIVAYVEAIMISEPDIIVDSEEDLITTNQLAAILKVHPQTVHRMRQTGEGPPFERLGPRIIRYKRKKVAQWREQRCHKSTAEYT